MRVAVIGGGAAGFFAALSCKSHHPQANVCIYEKSAKTLAKVKVSGGGRCNVTNACESVAEFLKHYPRGQKHLKKTFHYFNRNHTIQWFEQRGVALKAEADGRMFPVTDDSQTIIDCLRSQADVMGIAVNMQRGLKEVLPDKNGFLLTFEGHPSELFDCVIVASGGSPKMTGYDALKELGHEIVAPVPSLFTFNIHGEAKLKAMMGLAVPDAVVKIQSTKLQQQGPVLVTHWGLSGPAVLKLSAWGARDLHQMDYKFKVQINWTGASNEETVRDALHMIAGQQPKKKISNAKAFDLPNRLWEYLLDRVAVDGHTVWSELKKKDKNRLINVLINDEYEVKGKTTFKEEFVTSGGVALAEVDFNTMQSRKWPNLFFAGEVLDIDGVTGGFNFQAAWSTGFVAGKLAR